MSGAWLNKAETYVISAIVNLTSTWCSIITVSTQLDIFYTIFTTTPVSATFLQQAAIFSIQ